MSSRHEVDAAYTASDSLPSAGTVRVPSVMLCLDHPAQHFATAFRAVAQSQSVKTRVLYWSRADAERFDPGFSRDVRWDGDLYSGYDHGHVAGSTFLRRMVSTMRSLRSFDPDIVVVYGWATPIVRIAALWAFACRKRVLFYGDSTWQLSNSPHLLWLRKLVLRSLFARASGALSTGTFNREFYILNGMHPAKVHDCVCPVDVTSFANARTGRVAGPELTVGYAGKLIARKGVDELLTGLAYLPGDIRWRARIIGEGPERENLQRLASRLGLDDRVEFLGFRNTSEMPTELADCDIVVVPSRHDLRVLVTTEAMAAGAAVVVSSNTAVWGRGDLIEHGVTGGVYKSGSPGDLAELIRLWATDRRLLGKIRDAGTLRAPEHGPLVFSRRLEQAIAETLSTTRC